jgi:hypothetical protein
MKIQQFIKIVFAYITEFTKNFSLEDKQEVLDELNIHLALITNTMKQGETNREALIRVCKENLGRDITPLDNVPDSVACAESVSSIIKAVLPDFPIIPSTYDLDKYLRKDKRFEPTLDLESGNIIISPTGRGNGLIVGHTGLILEDSMIASNSSNNGHWEINYTIPSWIKRYRQKGGFPIFVFRLKD